MNLIPTLPMLPPAAANGSQSSQTAVPVMFTHLTGFEPVSPHGYLGIEAATVERITQWIGATTGR